MVCRELRNCDRDYVIGLIESANLNHVEKKILVWGFLDRMPISHACDKLFLSPSRVKHLKRGAIDKIYSVLGGERYAKDFGTQEEEKL